MMGLMVKVHDDPMHSWGSMLHAAVLTYRKTLDFLFYLSMINNIFSIFGFAGVLNAQKELVTGFFAFNAVQMVVGAQLSCIRREPVADHRYLLKKSLVMQRFTIS